MDHSNPTPTNANVAAIKKCKSGTEPVWFPSGLGEDQTNVVVNKDQLGNPESLI